jgi:hypothetical protein
MSCRAETIPTMSDLTDLADLQAYLVRTSRLNPAEAARLTEEVVAFLDETPEEFIRRRHHELQAQGLANPAIYTRIGAELERRRFRAPRFTVRQLRRIVYG